MRLLGFSRSSRSGKSLQMHQKTATKMAATALLPPPPTMAARASSSSRRLSPSQTLLQCFLPRSSQKGSWPCAWGRSWRGSSSGQSIWVTKHLETLREAEEESGFSRRVCSRSHVKWLCLRGSWRVCSRSDQWFKFQFVIINWPWRKEISHSPPPLPPPPRPVVVAAPTFYFYVLLLLYLLLNVLFLFIYHNFDRYCKILDIYIF